MTILVLDKGHVGANSDPGAIGFGLLESDITNIIVDNMVNILQQKYIVDVKVTPRSLNLTDRTNFSNNCNADYFLSVHINAANTQARGFESHIYTSPSNKSIEYQKIIHDEIYKYIKPFGSPDRGYKRSNFAMVRQTNCPAMLIECLFIDQIDDAKLLKDNKFLDGLADSIVNGLVKCFNLQLKVTENLNTNNNKEELIDMAIEKWMKDAGINSLDSLIKNGIINDGNLWSNKMDEKTDNWLLFTMMARLLEKINNK